MICLGTNDHAGSVGLAAYRANIERMIDRIKSAVPLVDIVLVGPGPNGNTGSYTIDDYITVLYAIAVERDLPFINLKASLGTYEEALARELYEDPSHPNARGGKVIGRALWRALYAE